MRLQACLNGPRPLGTPLLPMTPDEIARDALACREAGAVCLHLHPRAANGTETIAPDEVSAVLRAVRAAVPGMPVGLSTGDWIGARAQRFVDIEGWADLPDYVTVNLSEPDAPAIMSLMRSRGVGLELSLSDPADLTRLLALPGDPAEGAVRIILGMIAGRIRESRRHAADMLGTLRTAMPRLPVMMHGFEATAWDFVALARQWGCAETRIGMEDVLTLPDGTPAGNAALVAEAARIIAPCPAFPRPRDDQPHAWQLSGPEPVEVWERFSPAYEAQAERLARALAARGFDVSLDGAGSEDGEFVSGRDETGRFLLLAHLEDPSEAREIAAMDDAALSAWIDAAIGCDRRQA